MTKIKQKIRAMIDAFKFYMQLKSDGKREGHSIDPLPHLKSKRDNESDILKVNSHTLDAGEEVISIKRDKMHELIEQKKNRTPFYKDDNKKSWE